MTKFNSIALGYDLDAFRGYGIKTPITSDISFKTNSHILLAGMSGSGKSFAEQIIFAKLAKHGGEFFFADFKQDDFFSYLRGCTRYFSFRNTLDALDIVYSKLTSRLSGNDISRHPITLIWDEYIANILMLINEDKKLAAIVMNKISEILLMGRSMSIRLITVCQRPDSLAFPVGSRLNYGIIVVLGAAVRSIYEMVMSDFIAEVEGRRFKQGEGVVLLQGSLLKFIKIAVPRNTEQMKKICIRALS